MMDPIVTEKDSFLSPVFFSVRRAAQEGGWGYLRSNRTRLLELPVDQGRALHKADCCCVKDRTPARCPSTLGGSRGRPCETQRPPPDGRLSLQHRAAQQRPSKQGGACCRSCNQWQYRSIAELADMRRRQPACGGGCFVESCVAGRCLARRCAACVLGAAPRRVEGSQKCRKAFSRCPCEL